MLGAPRARAFCRTTVCPDCPLDDNACPTGLVIQWPQLCVSYDLQYQASKQVSLADAEEVVRKAFGAWQNAPCPGSGALPSIHVLDSFGPVACKVHEYNQTDGNANVIMFLDDAWPYDDVSSALALTTVTFNYKTGDIYDVDMEINGTRPLSTSDTPDPGAFDLQSILTHETGHFLGLAHSLDPDATMRASYSEGDTSFRDLAPDDIAGICAVYPPADPSRTAAVCDFTPRGGFSPECGIYPTHGGMCALARVGENGAQVWWPAAAAAMSAMAVGRRRRPRSRQRSCACGSPEGDGLPAVGGASTDRRRRSAGV
jgi:hypothetical protein